MCLRATQKAASPSGQQQSQKTQQARAISPALLGGGSALRKITCEQCTTSRRRTYIKHTGAIGAKC